MKQVLIFMKQILLLLTLLIGLLGYTQTQIGQDIDGESAFDSSGVSVSLSSDGNIVAIGAPGNDGNGSDSGHVRVYQYENSIWTQVGSDINGEVSQDGSAKVSLNGDGTIVAIGATSNNGNGIDSGHVRVYQYENSIWTQIGQDINGEAAGDLSGAVSLSADGDFVAIGAFFNDGNGDNSGHVRVYQYENSIWTQIGSDIDGEAAGDWSGRSVSLSSDGSIVAIGADRNSNRGHVRIYKNINSVWTQIGSDIDGEALGDYLGGSLSLSADGNIVAIGGTGNNNFTGLVRVYKNSNDVWVKVGSDIDGEAEFDNSGESVSLSSDGSIVAIGAHKNSGNGYKSGHVRIYKNINSVWTRVGEDMDGEVEGDEFGVSVSLSSDGNSVAIGSYKNDGNGTNSGHVRVFNVGLELALLEVVEDITGNSNGVNVTASQLNSITGVSGAIEGVNYTTAFANGTFADEYNPTAAEIQFIIDQVNETLSIKNNNISSFKIYPNPSKNRVTIGLSSNLILEKIEIFNNVGLLITTSQEKEINTSTLSSGVYFIIVTTNGMRFVKKLIVE
jgi:hypothetical protein